MLEPLGLTPTEERVYGAMVTGQTATLADLAGQTGMSRTGIARAVQMLAAKGLVTRLPGRAVRFSALDPAIAVSTLTQNQQQALLAARDHMLDLARLYSSRHDRTHPAEQVEVIDGRDNVWRAVTRLEHAATRQIRIFDTPPYHAHPEAENSGERVILGKGVTVRCVYARDGVFLPGRDGHIRGAISRGEQARTTASLPMKMMICDSQMALIPLMPASADGLAAAYLIHHPSSLLDALAALFEAYWDQSVPLNPAAFPQDPGAHQAEDNGGVSDADHRILMLLAAGATDDAIGRATGCSMRTVQRRIRDLMRVAGAQTRFQLGMAATHRHWV